MEVTSTSIEVARIKIEVGSYIPPPTLSRPTNPTIYIITTDQPYEHVISTDQRERRDPRIYRGTIAVSITF